MYLCFRLATGGLEAFERPKRPAGTGAFDPEGPEVGRTGMRMFTGIFDPWTGDVG